MARRFSSRGSSRKGKNKVNKNSARTKTVENENKEKEVSIRIGQKNKKKPVGADVWKRVDNQKKDIKKTEKIPAPTILPALATVRKQDEHVGFNDLKQEIKNKLNGNELGIKGAATSSIQPTRDNQEFIKSGIRGLDEILGGGLPKDSIVLLSGTCGTGKSIFGMNFLIEGAMKGEPGIYIALEESPESNIQQMKLFGWPVDDMIRNKKLMILQPELYNFDALLTTIEDSIDRIKAKRLVIDAISIIGMYFEDPYKVRKSILQLGALLKKMKCTTIAIDEVREGESSLSAYGVEEFVVDGVIVLYLIKRSNIYLRAAVIRKMRGVNHSTKIHPMEIKSPGGIVIYPSQELFEEVS